MNVEDLFATMFAVGMRFDGEEAAAVMERCVDGASLIAVL